MAETVQLTLGHSPDPDDAFMHYALARNKIDTGRFRFEHILQDIQTLNERATRGELDITAISVHAYAYVADKYALLPSGASMGDRYGPMVVAREPMAPGDLRGRRIAVPGLMTSAYLELRLAIGDFEPAVVPFDEIIDSVAAGEHDAGLIIHEGQLTYAEQGLHSCLELGLWWDELSGGLPLPLGANTIHKRHGDAMPEIARILENSIRYGLEHREEALDYALGWARDMKVDLADRFVGMYVNHWTLDYGDKGRAAIRLLLDRAHAAGLIPEVKELEFVET